MNASVKIRECDLYSYVKFVHPYVSATLEARLCRLTVIIHFNLIIAADLISRVIYNEIYVVNLSLIMMWLIIL